MCICCCIRICKCIFVFIIVYLCTNTSRQIYVRCHAGAICGELRCRTVTEPDQFFGESPEKRGISQLRWYIFASSSFQHWKQGFWSFRSFEIFECRTRHFEYMVTQVKKGQTRATGIKTSKQTQMSGNPLKYVARLNRYMKLCVHFLLLRKSNFVQDCVGGWRVG